jgi:hypothetical protein
MIERAMEFLRIADPQPTDDKVRRRTDSSSELVRQISSDGNRKILLSMVQGIVGGFDKPPFAQDSPAVTAIIKTIKDKDTTLPVDLKDNALELQAVTAIALGELLNRKGNGEEKEARLFASLAIQSALSIKPESTKKHIRYVHEILLSHADRVLQVRGKNRRVGGTEALAALDEIDETTPSTDLWEIVVPALRAAIAEVTAQAAIDREEIETLWWMFAAHSDIANKKFSELTPAEAALCCGIELAKRSLLPPASSSAEMVKRMITGDRDPASLGPLTIKELAEGWPASMRRHLSPSDAGLSEAVTYIPAILPLTWASHRLSSLGENPKLGKEFASATGLALTTGHLPAEWGSQVFRESILQRMLAEPKES